MRCTHCMTLASGVASELAHVVLDPHVSLVQSADLLHAEVHVPQAVVDGLQAHVLAVERAGDVDPLLAPADPAVGADQAAPAGARPGAAVGALPRCGGGASSASALNGGLGIRHIGRYARSFAKRPHEATPFAVVHCPGPAWKAPGDRPWRNTACSFMWRTAPVLPEQGTLVMGAAFLDAQQSAIMIADPNVSDQELRAFAAADPSV